MEDTKKWYESKAIWGGIGAALSGIAGLWGVTLDQTMVDAVVNNMQIVVSSIVAIVSGIIGIIGRFKAKTIIQ